MGAAFFIISILGCADGSTQCTPVATVPIHYATQAACAAATGDALVRNSDLDFPSLLAECHSMAAPAAASREPAKAVRMAARS